VSDVLQVPPDFAPHFRKSPVTDAWEPLYSQRAGGVVRIGLRLDRRHCNSRGFVHGGVIAVLADNAMGLSVHESRKTTSAGSAESIGSVTMNLAVDFLATARIGDWLEISPRVLKHSGSTGFVDALVTCGETIVARASAVFRIADRKDS
jgi:acyl-coenzyme A thioesterase PaaI-like protein